MVTGPDNNIINDALTRPNLSPMGRFQQISEIVSKLLIPGEKIDTETYEALGSPLMLLIGNSRLNLHAMRLRPADYQSIGTVSQPGLSAILNYLPITEHDPVTCDMIAAVKIATVAAPSDRRDNIWVTDLPRLTEAGFEVFYTPVKTNPLHVRLIWEDYSLIEFPVQGDIPEIPDEVLRTLKGAFTKLKKLKEQC